MGESRGGGRDFKAHGRAKKTEATDTEQRIGLTRREGGEVRA